MYICVNIYIYGFFNSLVGLIGLIIGFFLSEISKWLTDKKENKKKIKRK